MKANPETVANFEVPAAILDKDFLADLDVAFDDIQMKAPAKKKGKGTSTRTKKDQMTGVHATFLALTRLHLQPTLRYLKAIEKGVTSKDICELMHYVVGPLVMKAKKVGLTNQTKALIDFQRSLKRVLASSARQLTDDQRQELSDKFFPVEELFDLDFRGHSSAVVNLMGFFKKVKRAKNVTDADLKKLFAIGIPSLSMLRKSSIAELSSLSGIPAEKMSVIRKTARDFSILSVF